MSKVDNTAPSISCPATQTLVLGAECTAPLPNYTSLATTSDNCGVQSVTQSPSAGATASGAGNMTVTLTVTDVNGNSNSCQFMVNKVDNTSPTISCPGTQVLVLGLDCTAGLPDYTSLATTGDNCGMQSVTQSPAAGGPMNGPGNATVTLTATDVNGNSSNCTMQVSVEDQTAPVAVCQNTTVYLGANGQYTLQESDVLDLANSYDNCSFSVNLISPAVVDCEDFGSTIPVLVSITDPSSNTATCLADVYVGKGYGMPSPWAGKDIGYAGAGNSYEYDPCQSPPVFTITANANNSSPGSDNLALISQELCGDFQITVRLEEVTPTGSAGLTAREDSAPGSKMVGAYTNLNNIIRWETRAIANGNKLLNFFFRPQPYWLRLQRQGSWFYSYYSNDGVHFSIVTAQPLAMEPCLEVGMGAFTNVTGMPATAVFSQVSVSGGVLPLVQLPPTEVAPGNMERSISLYPNPAREVVVLNRTSNSGQLGQARPVGAENTPSPSRSSEVRMLLHNELGQVLETRLWPTGELRLEWPVEELAPGIYFIEVMEEGQAPQVLRFVKQE